MAYKFNPFTGKFDFVETNFQVDGIAVTTTDGLVLQNTTAATAGVPVQQSPRLRFRSNVWNTTAVAANNTDDWWFESVPVSSTSPLGQLKFGSSLNGAAATYPLVMTSDGDITVKTGGSLTVSGHYADSTGFYQWSTRSILRSPADGQINILNQAQSAGAGFDTSTDAFFKIRTRAQTGYATVDALAYQYSGSAPAATISNPADPTGTTNTTGLMMGLAGTITTRTTKVFIQITGSIVNGTGNDGAKVQIRYGTGSAPANAAALTGTALGSLQRFINANLGTEVVPFSVCGVVTGLTAGTAYWLDVGLAAITAGTASITDVTVAAFDLPA